MNTPKTTIYIELFFSLGLYPKELKGVVRSFQHNRLKIQVITPLPCYVFFPRSTQRVPKLHILSGQRRLLCGLHQARPFRTSHADMYGMVIYWDGDRWLPPHF